MILWKCLHTKAAIGVCDACSEVHAGKVKKFYPLTFQGKHCKKVMPGEFFTTDATLLYAGKDSYICLEIEFRGSMIPYHEESILPVFVKENDNWIPSKRVPCPGMIGCDRSVKASIGFLGDSITQGIGTAVNSYLHWNARIAEAIGPDYSYWNLSIGYGRAADAASDGAWLFKAKRMDMVVMCYGVNDVGFGRTEEQIKKDLLTIISELRKAGVKVLIQTLPPMSMQAENLGKWLRINDFIRHTLSQYADCIFEVTPLLLDGAECEGRAKYGAHPNEEGCRERLIS